MKIATQTAEMPKINTPLKNSLFSLIGYVLPVILALLFTPWIVKKLGLEQYGVYILINTIITFLLLLDLGFSSALIKFLSKFHSANQHKEVNKMISTSNSFFLIVGLAGLAIMIALGFIITAFTPLSNPVYFRECFIIAGFAFLVIALTTPSQMVPGAILRYDISTALESGKIFIYNCGALLLVLNNFGLQSMMFWQLIIMTASLIIYLFTTKRILRLNPLAFKWHFDTFKMLFNFGIKTFVGNVATTMLNFLDRLLIPIFLLPSALTYYSLPGNITGQTGGIVGSLTTMLFPLTSRLDADGERDKVKSTYLKAFRLTAVLSAAITVAIILFRQKLLFFWLGGDFYIYSAGVMGILAVVSFILSLGKSASSVLLGLEKNKFLAWLSMAMAAINLIALLILIPMFGIMGAAIAFLIAVLPTLIAIWFLEVKVLAIDNFWLSQIKLFMKIIIVGLIIWPITQYILLPFTNSIITLIILGPLDIALYILIYRILGFFEKEDVRSIGNYIK